MNIVFTICSVNYLAGAKTLRKSIRKHDPESKFVYIIADKIENRIGKEFFEGDEFVEVAELGLLHLDKMVGTYNLTEFNTAIKPFALTYLHKKNKTAKFIYFDPDIIVFDKLDKIWDKLSDHDFIVTPHILQPITDDAFYGHQVGALNTGVFNLGFIAVNYNESSFKIIQWWEKHMQEHGHCNSLIGEFYDQKIMNLLPIYSTKLHILKDPGSNVAGWNIHERKISGSGGKYTVNGDPLTFYHYSGFVTDKGQKLISKYNKLTVEDNSALAEILDQYRNSLAENGNEKLRSLKCLYELQPDIHRASRFKVFSHKITKLFK